MIWGDIWEDTVKKSQTNATDTDFHWIASLEGGCDDISYHTPHNW